ncbi:MAG: hypothetical protein HKO57_02680 [Akkermansiaceae bacterium]|nr:hypothetical protein [Akkermansiaceae bacterium]
MTGDRSGGTMEKREIGAILCANREGGRQTAGLPPISVPGPPPPPPSPLELAENQLDVTDLNSRPGANGVIYLDFDGETVSGTQWNASFTGGAPIVAGAAGFSDAQIQLVWEGISEDYRPFNVNVTTNRAVYDSYPTNRKTMMIFTPDNEWYGTAGGVAYVDIFGSSSFDEPGWVFTDQLLSGGNPHAPFAAEAGSHEAGHVVGLRHDGTSTVEYYAGHGSGATSWAPIMGNSYQRTVTHWSRGEYNDASNLEDDLAIIAGSRNGLGYVTDDHGNSTGAATPMTLTGGDGVSAGGLIERNTDIDMFSIETAGGSLSITGTNAPTDPNLDIRLRLLDAQGAQVAIADPLSSLDATLNATVAAGTYYLEVDGVGTGSPATAYNDYGSLGDYTLTGTVPQPATVTAEILSPAAPGVSVPAGVGLVLEGSAAGGAIAWQVLDAPAGGSASFSSPTAASTRCTFSGEGIYELRLQADSGAETADDTLFVSVEPAGAAKAFPNRGASIDFGPDRNVYDVSTVVAPVVTDDGIPAPASLGYEWSILAGNGNLSDGSVPQPGLDFGAPGAVSLRLVVNDGEIRTYAEGTLTGRFVTEVLSAADAALTYLVPPDGSVDGLWPALGFDDSGWQAGALGIGYDANKGPSSRRIYLPLIATDVEDAVYENAPGCYVRIPFTVGQAGRVLNLTLRVKYDDAFVGYVNGLEVARANALPGPPDWTSLAATKRNDEEALSFQNFTITLPPGVLVDGVNVLALHGMNGEVGRKDRGFILVSELEATLKESPFLATVSTIPDPLLQDPGDDPDRDGRSNLWEHGSGTDPMTPDGDGVITLAPGVEVRLRMPAVPPDDVRYELQRSGTLDGPSWEVVATRLGPGPWTGQQPASVIPAGGGYEDILFMRAEAPRDFYRLVMTLIVP